MDPYDVLNLPPSGARACTVEQVRYNYKLLARQLHPDKRAPGVTQEDATVMFQVLTDAYRHVVKDIERHRADRTHLELKQAAADHAGRAQFEPRVLSTTMAKFASGLDNNQRFNIAKFNKVFDDVRVRAPEDRGYSDWMKDNHDSWSLKMAQEEEGARLAKQKAVQKYRDPAPTPLPGRGGQRIAFTELGQTRCRDFGGNDYSDYRIAHTTTRLADEDAKHAAEMRQLTYESLKHARETASFEMNDEDREAEHKRALERDRREERRRNALARHDRLTGEQHEMANRLLLN